MDAAELLKKVTDEIVEVHDFISGWFRGEIEQNEAKLQQEFMNRFVASFVNLQPAGNKLDYDKLQTMMTSNWGVNPEFHIKIHDVEVVWCSENDENVLATYIETQTGARNTTPATNSRFSTVFFCFNSQRGAYRWHHLQETALRP